MTYRHHRSLCCFPRNKFDTYHYAEFCAPISEIMQHIILLTIEFSSNCELIRTKDLLHADYSILTICRLLLYSHPTSSSLISLFTSHHSHLIIHISSFTSHHSHLIIHISSFTSHYLHPILHLSILRTFSVLSFTSNLGSYLRLTLRLSLGTCSFVYHRKVCITP